MVNRSGQRQKSLCLQCRHFYVTYDGRQPRGCRAFGFKSRQMPADVVLAGSGKACTLFVLRKKQDPRQ
ncbi:MAG TPA: uracil-DNA glycosylase [Desulfobulbus sp.]|nr:uracil-DNA glycosylase [Desulfobulbus sp.]